MAQVGKEAVGDVDHGRGSGSRGSRSGAVADLRYPVRLDHHARRTEASAEYRETCRSPAQSAMDGDQIAWPCSRPQHRVAALQ